MKPIHVMLITSFVGSAMYGVYNNIKGKNKIPVDAVIISNSVAIIVGMVSRKLLDE